MISDREAYIALNLIEGIGPVKTRALIGALGSPADIFIAAEGELSSVRGIGPELARTLMRERDRVDPRGEEKAAGQLGARILTPLDDGYPARLKEIHDPPLALYVKGDLAPRHRHAVAMVGSRRCTHYGRQTADRLAYQMARAGMTVVSGLARGIDTAAHQGAMKGGGDTLAVLGGALDRIYPAENESLAKSITAQGALLSEYPLGREPDRTTFPYRNRVVSGMCLGVVVVEAPEKSGSLITADCANEHGRLVFAVPGRIDSPPARGCNRLIKDGAVLVQNVEDILQEFETLLPEEPRTSAPAPEPELTALPFQLNDDEKSIIRVLADGETDLDSLAREAGIKSHQASALLIGLEMKKIVSLLPGHRIALRAGLETPGSSR